MIDYSDQYMFWDNVEPLGVDLKQPSDNSTVTCASVPCKRVPAQVSEGNYSGVGLNTVRQTWWVPALPLTNGSDQLPLNIKDQLREAGDAVTWSVESILEARVGGSLSHYAATCVKCL